MDAIIFFDIRNFSAHRQYLAQTHAARSLSDLVKKLLEKAVSVSKAYMRAFDITKLPLLNHTGDGFVLVFRDGRSCLAALKFVSEFREFAEKAIGIYQRRFPNGGATSKAKGRLPPPLYYGMGVHCGFVTMRYYQGFSGKRTFFLGSAVNIAGRVEGCTKDHPCPVLCTSDVLSKARKELGKPSALGFDRHFHSLGPHNLRGLEGSVELVQCDPGLQFFLKKHGNY